MRTLAQNYEQIALTLTGILYLRGQSIATVVDPLTTNSPEYLNEASMNISFSGS